ncbi:MAG: glycosyltransferase family 2 protein [Lachnospiraceae bacterium]|nr:glycosyltransferase family 2 protein [Lachnospiraceae bacterium]
MKPMISVIVPVYQAKEYLRPCVESILAQRGERKNHLQEPVIEIVLVDDESTDGSEHICDEYAGIYEQIRVIHKKNEGLTAAWKTGVELAQGEYVGFVDSDDWIAPDMYARLYEKAVETKADIVCCGIRHIFQDHSHADWDDEMQFPEDTYTQQEMRGKVYPSFINDGSFMGRGLQPNRVSKLVKRSLVMENMYLCHNDVTVGEDYQFSFAIFLEAPKIAIIKGFLPYYYRINTTSMTGAYDLRYMDKIKCMKEQLLRISRVKNVYPFEQQIWNDFLCLVVLHIKGGIMAQKKDGFWAARKNIKRVCEDADVRKALETCNMDRLTKAERLFLAFMKLHFYFPMYLAVSLYFKA